MTRRRTDSGLDGLLLIDKPAGWTSHDVVAKVRRITGQPRTGHTGTLDPLATGLLVLCLGAGTRVAEYLQGHDKAYEGSVRLGARTSTDDAAGDPLETRPVPPLDAATLERTLTQFRGPILQRPPAFSALKIGGKRAYELARAGAEPKLAPRPVTIYELSPALIAPERLSLRVRCSAGTYIRSLARDMGEALGCGGHLVELRRTHAGPFSLADAISLEELERLAAAGRLDEVLLPIDEALSVHDAALVSADAAQILASGGWWQTESGCLRSAKTLRIYSAGGDFVAVGSASESGEIRASKVFGRAKSAK